MNAKQRRIEKRRNAKRYGHSVKCTRNQARHNDTKCTCNMNVKK